MDNKEQQAPIPDWVKDYWRKSRAIIRSQVKEKPLADAHREELHRLEKALDNWIATIEGREG